MSAYDFHMRIVEDAIFAAEWDFSALAYADALRWLRCARKNLALAEQAVLKGGR